MRREAEGGKLGARDLEETLDTATDIAILDQEQAGNLGLTRIIHDGRD